MSISSESPSAAVCGGESCPGGEFMLFGVRVKVDPMRKSVSMNNLSDYEPVVGDNHDRVDASGKEVEMAAEGGGVTGYASADEAVRPRANGGGCERKRGVPWTEEEHKLFLLGLQKVGKGDWRGISRNYVKTRTPTQVASHAQKYFLRRTNLNRRRRRSSLFDITTDSVTTMPMEEGKNHQENNPTQQVPQPTFTPLPVTSNISGFSFVPFPMTVGPVLLSMQGGNPMESSSFAQMGSANNSSAMLVHQVPVFPMPVSSPMVDLNLNQQVPLEPSSHLSLGLSLSTGQGASSTSGSGFQVISSFKNGDSNVIRVA